MSTTKTGKIIEIDVCAKPLTIGVGFGVGINFMLLDYDNLTPMFKRPKTLINRYVSIFKTGGRDTLDIAKKEVISMLESLIKPFNYKKDKHSNTYEINNDLHDNISKILLSGIEAMIVLAKPEQFIPSVLCVKRNEGLDYYHLLNPQQAEKVYLNILTTYKKYNEFEYLKECDKVEKLSYTTTDIMELPNWVGVEHKERLIKQLTDIKVKENDNKMRLALYDKITKAIQDKNGKLACSCFIDLMDDGYFYYEIINPEVIE